MLDLASVQHLRKVVLVCLAAPLLLSLLVVQSATATDSGPHLATEIIGWAAIVLCIAGRTWCSFYIGGRKAARLINEGPYSVVRNPLYVFSAIGAAGVALSAGSVVLAMAAAVVTVVIFNTVIGREERHLREHLGAPYEAYLKTTPRWWPRLSNWRDAAAIEIVPRLVIRTFIDGLWFAALIPLLEVVEQLQGAGVLPVLTRLP